MHNGTIINLKQFSKYTVAPTKTILFFNVHGPEHLIIND